MTGVSHGSVGSARVRKGRFGRAGIAWPRVVAALIITALMGVGFPEPTAAASARASQSNFGSATVTTETLGGADQYDTAVAISKSLRPGGEAPVVYLVSGAAAPDALAAGPAAVHDGGVILYTETSSLPTATGDELVRLDPGRVEVVGGNSVISDGVLNQVAVLLPSAVVERVAGADSYGTAAAFSAATFKANTGTTFHPIVPVRVLDSRIALGATRFKSRVKQSFAVGGAFGIPSEAVAVTGNVTVVGQTQAGYVTVAPSLTSGQTLQTSTINFPAGDIRANGVTVALGPGGHLDAMYSAGSTATINIVFDVTGYLANDSTGATYHAMDPVRVVDSRVPLGATRFHSQVKQSFSVGGAFGIPSDAVAVTGNVTVVNQTQAGYVTVAPILTNGQPLKTSTINFPRGDTRANGVTVALGPDGKLDAEYWAGSAAATVDILFDVTGYFTRDPAAGTFHAVTPVRVLDSRIPLGAPLFYSRVKHTFVVRGRFGIPSDAIAVTGNVTVVGQTQGGYVTVAPALTDGERMLTSTINFPAGDIRANGVTVALGPDGSLDAMYVAGSGSTTNLVFDVTGYFADDPESGPYHASATVVIASDQAPSDAVVAGSAAAALAAPYLLVNKTAVPSATAAELTRIRPDHALVVGDTTAIPDAVLTQLRTFVPNVERLAGADTYGTAGAIATRFFPHATSAILTSGPTYTGGLASIPLALARGAPILPLDDTDVVPAGARDVLISLRPAHLVYVGTPSILDQAEAVGFSDGRLTKPTDTSAYPAYDSGYHDPGELVTILRAEEIAYPNLVHVFSIGKSYQGRDIWAAKVSSDVGLDQGKPETLVDALHHANEHIGVEQALYLLETLTSGYSTDPYVTRIVNERVTWIVFALNPDGWDYDLGGGHYHYWRKNRQPAPGSSYVGTDINRNYAYKWGCCGGSSSSPGAWNYRGTAAFSTPEATALANFVASRVVDGKQRIKTHVTLHANDELILYPYSYTKTALPGDMTADDHAVFVKLAQTMASLDGYKYEQSSGLYITDGDEIDWLYHDQGIFSFTVELYPTEQGSSTANDYPPYSVIPAQVARNRSMLLYVIDVAACPYSVVGLAAQYCPGAPEIIPAPAGTVTYPAVEASAGQSPGEPENPEQTARR